MDILDILRNLMETDKVYTIDDLNNLLRENKYEYNITDNNVSLFPDNEFSVKYEGSEYKRWYIRKLGNKPVKLPPNVSH